MITPQNVRRNTPQRYRLEGNRCKKCGKVFFPPRLICNECSSLEFETYTLPNEGEVIAFTIIRIPPKGFTDEVPYALAIVELQDKTRIMCQLADFEEEKLKMGLKVHLEFRKIQEAGESGVIAYGYKAVTER